MEPLFLLSQTHTSADHDDDYFAITLFPYLTFPLFFSFKHVQSSTMITVLSTSDRQLITSDLLLPNLLICITWFLFLSYCSSIIVDVFNVFLNKIYLWLAFDFYSCILFFTMFSYSVPPCSIYIYPHSSGDFSSATRPLLNVDATRVQLVYQFIWI